MKAPAKPRLVWRTDFGWIFETSRPVPHEVIVLAAKNAVPQLLMRADEAHANKSKWLMAIEFLRLWAAFESTVLQSGIPRAEVESALRTVNDPEYQELQRFLQKLTVQQTVRGS